ncbi:MAG: diguanylate cyclase [Candidatus Omnitrophica bacterium]|nr:diguanylate cyclase [Candidatus Omnitrophota bacterium]
MFTLKNRIILILAIFTIITIALFVFIQLSHEIHTINKIKETNATVISLILQNTWDKISILNVPPAERIKFFSRKINSLKEANEIVEAYVLDKEGNVVFSTKKELEGAKGDFNDTHAIKEANEGKALDDEIFIDETTKTLSQYVVLQEQDGTKFFVRIFFSLGDIWQAYARVYQPAFIIGALLILLNVILAMSLSRLVIGPIKVFSNAAKIIASGRLDLRVNVATSDELEALAKTFNFMTDELIKMKERAENANPLTKLPGNIVIREEIEKRISQEKKITVIYCDLDNFKAYNDKYGIAKGDEAITLTGEIFKEAIKVKGNSEDFIGHEGGDDFLLITTPQQAKSITDYIISEFDKRIRSLFDNEDLERGFIVAHARDGSVKQFPIMTISLAGISNEFRRITSYAEVTNIAAEIKKKAKKLEKSCFVLDQRKEE